MCGRFSMIAGRLAVGQLTFPAGAPGSDFEAFAGAPEELPEGLAGFLASNEGK
jgi:hypothetical protein